MPSLSSLSALPELIQATRRGFLTLMPGWEPAPEIDDRSVEALLGAPWAIMPSGAVSTLDRDRLSPGRLLFTTPVFLLQSSTEAELYVWRIAASGRRGRPECQPFVKRPDEFETWFSFPVGHLSDDGDIILDLPPDTDDLMAKASMGYARRGFQAATLWSDILRDALAKGLAQRTH